MSSQTLPTPFSPPVSNRTLTALGLLVAVWLSMFLFGGHGWDRTLLQSLYAGGKPWEKPAILITQLGNWDFEIAMTFLAIGWLILKRRASVGLFLLAATLAGRVAISLQKIMFDRVRPAENAHLVNVTTLSFPSGHAGNSMIIYLLLALVVPTERRHRAIAVGLALTLSLLIGLSRTMLGVHWPSDVIGGWTFGILWIAFCLWLSNRLPDSQAVH